MTLKCYCKKGQWRTNHQNHYINAIIFQASPATSRRGSVNEPSSRSEGKVTVPDQSQQASSKSERTQTLFTEKTQCIVWGMQQRAVQGMLDFDYVCSRREPSVVAMIYPFTWVTFFLIILFVFCLSCSFKSGNGKILWRNYSIDKTCYTVNFIHDDKHYYYLYNQKSCHWENLNILTCYLFYVMEF